MESIILNMETCVVREPHMHDSILISIAVEPNSVHLRFGTLAGKIVRIVLDGVRGLSLEPMWEKNIVFEMRVVRATDAAPEDIRRVFHEPDDIDVGDIQLRKLKSDNFVIVQIVPTLGADILALCRGVKWQFD